MHAEMVMIFFSMLVLMQVALLMWRRARPRSFNTATLVGLWLFPMLMSAYMAYWRFLVVWAVYTAINAYVIHGARQQPVQVGTPRCVPGTRPSRVHRWRLTDDRDRARTARTGSSTSGSFWRTTAAPRSAGRATGSWSSSSPA